MANDNKEHILKEALEVTLHRFKNNLQTQMSLMNIQSSTQRVYCNEKKVIMDRMFALSQLYDLLYKRVKVEDSLIKSHVSFQTYILQFLQYLKTSTPDIEFELNNTETLKLKIDDLLILSYILIEVEDFRMSLSDSLAISFVNSSSYLTIKISFDSIKTHIDFPILFKDQFKIFELLTKQLKVQIDYKNDYVKLSLPTL